MPKPSNFHLTQTGEAIVRRFQGKWHGTQGMCRCPAHDDRTPSLSVTLGARAVLFHCFAGCTNEAVLRALSDQGIRITQLFDGPSRVHGPPVEPTITTSRNAVRLWQEAYPLSGSTADQYLQLRGNATTTPEIRFHPRTPLGPKSSVQFLPAMLAAVRSDAGIIAVHRTFIDPATATVASVDGPKRALGRLGTGAVRLGWPFDGKLGLAEGIETALSATQIFGIPCWATLGNERFGKVAIPDSVTELHLFIDADKGGSLAETRARAAHRRSGRTIFTHCPPIGGQDWNDVLMAAATHDASNPSGGEGGWGG